MLSKEKQIEVMTLTGYTKEQAEQYLASGQCTVWDKAEYEADKEKFPEDYEGDNIEEVEYDNTESYIIVTNWI